jgi:hypothetical protein
MTQTPLTISQLPSLDTVQGTDRLVLDRIGAAVTAGSFVVGQAYQIISAGNTSFTAIGAESNAVGAYFVATGVGTGTGTAGPINTGDAPVSALAALLGGDPAGTAAAAVAAHAAAADSHPGYTTPQEAAAAAPVQSVALSVPSGWSATSSNAGGSVTLTLALPVGYSVPSNLRQEDWDTAFTQRRTWDGGNAHLNAATGRASLELGTAALETSTALRDRSSHTGTQALNTISGLGTGVPTALTTNVGTAGSLVVLGGAGGTPSALGLINATGLPLNTGVTGLLPVAHGGTGTATPGLVQGANVTISGSWPNQTINATANAYSFAASQRIFGRNSAGAGPGEEISLSQLLDWGSSAQGTILYRGSSGWVALPPGTPGQFLRTAGAAADPAWAAPSGGGDALTASPLSQFAATTSAQLRGVISDETGSGLLFFQSGDLGTPSAGALTNCTGLPVSTGVTGLGTGIAAALAINAGSAGAPVLFNGAGGTPSSLTLANATGLPFEAGVSGKPTTLAGYGITDAVGSSDPRLSDARTPTAHNQAWSTITATPTTLAGYGITDGFTEGQVRATPLTGYTPAAGTVAATDSILQAFQKIVGNIAARALAGLIGSSGLTMATNRLAGRFDAGEGAVQEVAVGTPLQLSSGALSLSSIADGMIFKVTNKGEAGTAATNYDELPVAVTNGTFTISGIYFGCHIDSVGTGTATFNAYRRTAAGVKTSLLTANATLSAGASLVDATSLLTGATGITAGTRVGFDVLGFGGATGVFVVFQFTRTQV